MYTAYEQPTQHRISDSNEGNTYIVKNLPVTSRDIIASSEQRTVVLLEKPVTPANHPQTNITTQRGTLPQEDLDNNPAEEETWGNGDISAREHFDDLMGRLGVAGRAIRKGEEVSVEITPEDLKDESVVNEIKREIAKKEACAKNLTLEVSSKRETTTNILDSTSEKNIESIHRWGVGFGVDPFYVNSDGVMVPNHMFTFMCGKLGIMPRFIKINHRIYHTIISGTDTVYGKFRKYLDQVAKQGTQIIVYGGPENSSSPKQFSEQEKRSILEGINKTRIIESPLVRINGGTASSELSIGHYGRGSNAVLLQQIKDAGYTLMLFERMFEKAVERAEAGRKTLLSIYIKDLNNLQLMPIVWRLIKYLPIAARNRICIGITGEDYGELDDVFFHQLELLKKSGLQIGIDNLAHIEGTGLLGTEILNGCMDPKRKLSIDLVKIHPEVTEGITTGILSDRDLRNIDSTLAMLRNQSGEGITIVFDGIKKLIDMDRITLHMPALGESKKEILYRYKDMA